MLDFQENVPLESYTTFKIGGPARYFIEVEHSAKLYNIVMHAKKHCIPTFIIGYGSNILVSDQGFDGLVIKLNLKHITLHDGHIIHAEAGALISDVAKLAMKNGLSGLEWTAGLPGTVGGAVYNNSGCNGGEISDVVIEVCHFLRGIGFDEFTKDDFGYRKSPFKDSGRIILMAEFGNLKEGNPDEIKEKMNSFNRKRAETQPQGKSVGCIFKNPLVEGKRVSAGKLIDEAGLKGFRCNEAQVSEKHGNFILNLNNKAKARDVMKLIEIIEKRVEQKFGIKLEREIICLGFTKGEKTC